MDFTTGHCHKYKSTRGGDGFCHVLEKSEGFHMCPFPILFSQHAFLPDRAVSEPYWSTHTHTHEHPFTLIPVFLWSDTAADEKSKHSHSLKHTHGHAHVSFSTAPELLRGFQTACHVSHTLTVTSKCTLMAERTVYFFLNKWPHTHTHTQPSSMNSAFTILFSHTLWDWIESSQVCPKLMVIRNWPEIPSLVRMLTYQAETRDMAGQLSKGIPLVCIVMCTVEWK